MNNVDVPATIWLAAGLEGVSDPFAVTDAFTATVQNVIAGGGTVHMFYDPTLAPLALYIAREYDREERVTIWGMDGIHEPIFDRYPKFQGIRRTDSIADAIFKTHPHASIYLGGGPAIGASYAAASLIAKHDAFVLAATGGDTVKLRSFSHGRTLPDGMVQILKSNDAYPFVVRLALSWVRDGLFPSTPARFPHAGIRGMADRNLE